MALRLHLRDFRIRDAEPNATMTEHRIELVQLLDAAQERQLHLKRRPRRGLPSQLGQLDHEVLPLGQELV